MVKILMVCLGNICRSPMAEGILRAKIAGLNIEVDSAGTAAYHVGENPDARAVIAARKHNVNIASLVGRQFSVSDFDVYDVIYAMDKSNLKTILMLARNDADKQKVSLFLNELNPGSNADVPDPYYGGDSGFEDVYQLLNNTTDKIIEKYRNGK